jgi:hypothetical protein
VVSVPQSPHPTHSTGVEYDTLDVRIARIDANVQWITDTLNTLLTNLNQLPGFRGMMARKVADNGR